MSDEQHTITYSRLAWVNNDLDIFHAVDLVIDGESYGEQIIGKMTDIGQLLSTYLTDNSIVIPVESETVSEDVSTFTDAEIIARIQVAVQNILDAKARELNYDDGFAIASYANSTVEKFRTEARRFIAWRDQCWDTCYDFLGRYQAGIIPRPTIEEVVVALPSLTWTESTSSEPETPSNTEEEPVTDDGTESTD